MKRWILTGFGPALLALLLVVGGAEPELAGVVGLGVAFLLFFLLELATRRSVGWPVMRNDTVHAVLSGATAQVGLVAATWLFTRIPSGSLEMSWWLQIPLVVVGADLLAYWAHRAQHRVGRLWRSHALHHTPRELYALNGLRAHPGDTAFVFAVSTVWAVALGVDTRAFVVAAVVQTSSLLLQHARVRVPRVLEAVFVTPAWHAVHHARDAEGPVNLAHIFTVWDRVFGTFEVSREVALGIESVEGESRLRDELFLRFGA